MKISWLSNIWQYFDLNMDYSIIFHLCPYFFCKFLITGLKH